MKIQTSMSNMSNSELKNVLASDWLFFGDLLELFFLHVDFLFCNLQKASASIIFLSFYLSCDL